MSEAIHVEERSVRSFYADPGDGTETIRVCRGTSCELAGAAGLLTELSTRGPCHEVHCLGYCDRSPAALWPDGRVSLGLAQDPVQGGPDIRCLAPTPIVTARIGQGDHSEFDAARSAGVYAALESALALDPTRILDELTESGERGRGGAGFSTADKWRACAGNASELRYIVANGDEGDPGSYIDRILMEHDPHSLLEGMALAALAVGAREGFVFVRSEYPEAHRRLVRAVAQARAAGWLGDRIQGSSFSFEVDVVAGRGSYVCGEETALLNSIEGLRGEVRLRPPYPTKSGLYARPTVVNNVETLVNVPWIVRHGGSAYRALGTQESSGTKALCLSRGFAAPGIVEVEFGTNLRDVIDAAGGAAPGGEIGALLIGGPMGSLLFPDEWDVNVCYEQMEQRDVQLGHGGIVAIPRDARPRRLLLHLLGFMASESCGRCTPCALGSRAALELASTPSRDSTSEALVRLLEIIEQGSLCAFGQLMPGPIRRILDRFGEAALIDDAARMA